jgi:hypothetical protein
MDDSIPRGITGLKNEFMRGYRGRSLFPEVVPLKSSKYLPIEDEMLQSLHGFAAANPIYVRSYESEISGIACRVYEGDINSYWLASKKHDTSYQPFYPTWMLSAFALAHGTRSLGFEQLVDIGSGDGRMAYCANLLGMESYGIEIDSDLVELQSLISSATGVSYNAISADATRFDYGTLKLSRPIFFISGLPEMGEMLANNVIRQVLSIDGIKHSAGFNFMGSHVMKAHTRDKTCWGWGSVIASYDLDVVGTVTLPTLWTTDQPIDTPYVYTKAA